MCGILGIWLSEDCDERLREELVRLWPAMVAGDQPFAWQGARLWCNGEIYNSDELGMPAGFVPR